MANLALQGVFTALVTPFTADASKVDWEAFERHVEAQIAGGVSGLVPCGTTGESPTLAIQEHGEVIRRTVQVTRGRVPVLAGAGTNSTHETLELVAAATAAGADGVMLVSPYYNKPSQAGLMRHVETVAQATPLPLVLYNIPGRCVINIEVETILTLLDRCPTLMGVKDATNNVMHCQELLRRAGDRVVVVSGDDGLTLPMMSVGASGVISVTSNLFPREVGEVVELMRRGELAAARRKHFALLPVHAACFCEPNPAPAKGALADRGVMHATVRSPMVELSEAGHARMAGAIAEYLGS